jgi:adenylate cyclase class IV
MPIETERKYLEVDFPKLRMRLSSCGAVCQGVHFEANLVLDAPDRHLLARGCLLRLRLQRWADRSRSLLTLKLPLAAAGAAEGCKAMDERELEIQGVEPMRAVLEGLGYGVMARYEKVRETWQVSGAQVELDELPFCDVVEVTATGGGGSGDVDAAARTLGLDRQPASVQNYHQLHQQWLVAQGLPVRASFVFDGRRRGELEGRLGFALPPLAADIV